MKRECGAEYICHPTLCRQKDCSVAHDAYNEDGFTRADKTCPSRDGRSGKTPRTRQHPRLFWVGGLVALRSVLGGPVAYSREDGLLRYLHRQPDGLSGAGRQALRSGRAAEIKEIAAQIRGAAGLRASSV